MPAFPVFLCPPMVTLQIKDQGVELNETNLRFLLLASVPRPIWPPPTTSNGLSSAGITRQRSPHTCICLEGSNRQRLPNAGRTTLMPDTRSPQWYSGQHVSKGYAGPIGVGIISDRHMYVLGPKQFVAADALQPYTAMDGQLLTTSRSRQQSVSWDSRITAERLGWGNRIILGLVILGMHRNSGRRHLGATGEFELETAGGNSPRETCDNREACLWAERLAELLNLRSWCSPGVVGLMIIQGKQGDAATGPADLMAMGGRQNTHRSSGFNQQTDCVLSERDSSQSSCDPSCPLCNQHVHLCYARMTCGLAAGQTNSLKQRYIETSVESCGRAWGSHQTPYPSPSPSPRGGGE